MQRISNTSILLLIVLFAAVPAYGFWQPSSYMPRLRQGIGSGIGKPMKICTKISTYPKMMAEKGGGNVLDSAVNIFSSLMGIDFRSADERKAEEAAAPPKVLVEEEDVMTEEERARGEISLAEAARLKEEFAGLIATLRMDSISEQDWRDCVNRTRAVIQTLVTWIPEGGASLTAKGGNVSLSPAHISALRFIDEMQDLAKNKDAKLSSAYKWIPKKLGLSPLISIINSGVSPTYRTLREMRLACRDVERGVSEAVHVVATHAVLQGATRTDYVTSCRAGMEHIVVRDRHSAVILLSGYFRLLAAARPTQQPLSDTFKKNFPTDFAYSTAHARAAYPLVEVPLRQWAASNAKEGMSSIGLLERLSRSDSLGSTCEGLQRWAVEDGLRGMVDREAAKESRRKVRAAGDMQPVTLTHQLMRELIGVNGALIENDAESMNHWRASVEETGAMVALLAAAKDDNGQLLMGSELTVACNGVMLLSALATVHQPTATMYASLAASLPSYATLSSAWKQALDGLVKGLASLIGRTPDAAFRMRVEELLRTWRMPQLLLRMYALQADDEAVKLLLRTLLKALLSPNPDTELRKLRYEEPANLEHLSALDQTILQKWKETDIGTDNTESLFMMGEDTRTCMAIHELNSRTQKGLLGYLLQGNARLLVAMPAGEAEGVRSTKWKARAVARLLVRRDTGETVVFVDRAYFEGDKDVEAEALLKQQAQALAAYVGAPLYMASDAPPSEEQMQALKVPPASGVHPFPAVELVEKGGLSPYVWRDGRYGIGLLQRGEGVLTALGGNSVVVAVLFGGWSDCMSTYEEKTVGIVGGGNMRDVQDIGAAISNHVRGTRTFEKNKKRNPWDLTF